MIEAGQVAIVKISNEPVFVLKGLDSGNFVVRQARQTRDGIEYSEETLTPAELYSEEEALIKELNFTKLSLAHREKFSKEYEEAKKVEKINAMPTIAVADGTGYSN